VRFKKSGDTQYAKPQKVYGADDTRAGILKKKTSEILIIVN